VAEEDGQDGYPAESIEGGDSFVEIEGGCRIHVYECLSVRGRIENELRQFRSELTIRNGGILSLWERKAPEMLLAVGELGRGAHGRTGLKPGAYIVCSFTLGILVEVWGGLFDRGTVD
jgi:hypothetical protein